ncbi:hypothetical protein AMATHDRAFT_49079 [Amanita thiersii Skay4041]|uniref:Uncharacterized protein n=1 Tax=Amanita thiersii Skay4041 TaxID=703135 RepID=A0A2A9NMT3_9AGAR|nr:hypothetical protein AMATHDRAFT_49079 [Amanita thiersii Skay4041]
MIGTLTFITTFALFAKLPVTSAQSETTLRLPGFDPQPLSANFLSTDSQGMTIWELKGSDIPGTVTLVEGPGYVSLGVVDPAFTLNEACGVTGDIAVCTVTANGEVHTGTDIHATPITVLLGTPPPSATAGAASVTATPGPSSSGQAPSTSTTPTGSSVSASVPSTTASNGAVGRSRTVVLSGLGILFSALWLAL